MMFSKLSITIATLLAMVTSSGQFGMVAAGDATSPRTSATRSLVLYNWQDDIPPQVLESFTRQTGIAIDYHTFSSQEEAVETLRAGKVCDVAVIEGRFLPALAREELLHRLNYENIGNIKYISPNFRNLAYDPDNVHSIPYSWGTTGILVNTALAGDTVRRWGDFWDERYRGRVALSTSYPREALGMALKSFGYSVNSENPQEIETAFAKLHLLQLSPDSLHVKYPEFGPAMMSSNTTALAIGFSGDLLESRKQGLNVDYILPEEGLLLWADVFVVPKSSRHQESAELFINYLLQPEISAAIVNQKFYASANEAARPLIDPEILAEKAIYPSDAMLANAEIIEALSPAGQAMVDAAWQNFLSRAGKAP
jgi:spermidine/putrescine transport system substrate-binding protein